MIILFWALLGLLFYTYAGYPALALVLSRCRRRGIGKGACEPTVTLIIAAHNEGGSIEGTLRNKLALDYPPDKLQIIVVSDGSVDGTDDIVRGFAPRGVLYLRQEPRRGKTAALNLAVRHATGEVLVFADANSLYAPDAVRLLVRNFKDPEVGYVTGRLVYGAGGTNVGSGCRLYMAYEDALRSAETRLGSIVGVNGGIDAVRRSLYRIMHDAQLPDLVLPLSVVQRGYRVVYERDAVLHEPTLTTSRDEYRMRVRVALRAWCAISDMRALFNPRHGLFALQLFSHKTLRYLVFAMLPVLYTTALLLWSTGLVYQAVVIAGFLLLAAAALGARLERHGRSSAAFGVPYYFFLINAAAGHAFVHFLRGRRTSIWTPRLG
jgi:cellulose synthase/poly-beta-1,6-N-acetylglucosamine synthase-like glycosyltransferase